MQITLSESDDVTLLILNGRVDSSNAPQLGAALTEALEQGATQIVLDLEGVDYISSAGLRQMVIALKKLDVLEGDLRLASLSEHVREIFELSGFSSIFSIYDGRQNAVSSFRPIT